MVFYLDRILVPQVPSLKREIICLYHATPVAGHGGVLKTYKAILEIFYWKNMRLEVQEYVRSCSICQQVKYSTGNSQGLL